MTDTPSPSPRPSNKNRWRLWITLSELVGVLALLIAGLNFWDSHRDRIGAERRAAAAEQAAARMTAARTSFVLTARPEGDGARLAFQPMASSEQAIQSQRFLFPTAVADPSLDSVQPRIERDWLERGLRKTVEAERHAKLIGATGEGETPVGVVSTYIEDGEVRTDRSLYRVSYAWRTPLLGGPRFTLLGATLAHRAVKGDLQTAVETQWDAAHPAPTGK